MNNNKSGYALLLHCIGLPLAYFFKEIPKSKAVQVKRPALLF